MIDLRDTTFIIPVRIESSDREFNFKYVLQYLCDHLSTTIIISEHDKESKVANLLNTIDTKDCVVIHAFEQSNDPVFPRTRLLNEMLFNMVTTPIASNYDIDVFFKPETYLEAVNLIREKDAHLVYPYFQGESQLQITYSGREKLPRTGPDKDTDTTLWQSRCGHCQFFLTQFYKDGGGENENFISYGAEDVERMMRFQKFGYNVVWMPGHFVYHIEHMRGANSSQGNPHFKDNDDLFRKLGWMKHEDLVEYYRNVEYLKKYNK